jgi:hypothetical protein
MHAGHILVGPEESGNTVVGIEYFPRLPGLSFEQMLEIAQGLVQIQDQSMMNNRHGVTVAEDDN